MRVMRAIFALTALLVSAGSGYGAEPISKTARSSWPEKWENTLTEAKKEGKLVVYGQVGPELRVALTEALKKEFGLNMELVPGKGKEVITRFATEMHAGLPSADMIMGGASTLRTDPETYAAWDNLEPLLILPEVLDPKAWPNGRLPYHDAQKKLIPLILEVTQNLVANTNIVKPGQIKSYRDLLQPQWKGKIVMADPTISGTSVIWMQVLLSKAYGMAEGEAFLRKFATQEPEILRNSRLQIEWVARGRYPLTIGMSTQDAYAMHKAGAPIARLAVEEGSFVSGGGSYIVVPAKRPHPNAANLVLNWLLSKRGQEVFSKAYGGPPTRLGATTEGVSPMAFPIPGEKTYIQDEQITLFTDKAVDMGKRVFGHLVK